MDRCHQRRRRHLDRSRCTSGWLESAQQERKSLAIAAPCAIDSNQEDVPTAHPFLEWEPDHACHPHRVLGDDRCRSLTQAAHLNCWAGGCQLWNSQESEMAKLVCRLIDRKRLKRSPLRPTILFPQEKLLV